MLALSGAARLSWRRRFEEFAADTQHAAAPDTTASLNEVPTVLMIGIVILVIVKPF